MNHRSLLLLLATAVPALADGPKDNDPGVVRPVPPAGITVPAELVGPLTEGVKQLRAAIDDAAKAQAKNPRLADLLPDIEIYHKAVDWALRHHEFFKPEEFKTIAQEQLAEGMERARQLKAGDAPWTRQSGLVVRGYRSRIDGSVQPYGMVIPEGAGHGGKCRLDLWCHGRFENVCELQFIQQRRKQVGNVPPADGNTLVLQPYGRFSCANKFAGEIDLFEALEHAKKFYTIDDNRVMIRGFSMGGAATWQFATHYAGLWCGANPGAGFAETAEFLRVFQNEPVDDAPWYQKKLWHWYDSTDYALNLRQCPTVAYSGEMDKQKQAADMMEAALRAEQIDLLHIIGEQKKKGIEMGKGHRIEPESLVEIEHRLASIANAGRNPCPDEIHFTTWTLRYNTMHWLTVDALDEHWARCRVHADASSHKSVTIKTQNCAALTLDMPPGYCPLPLLAKVPVTIDGQKLEVSRPKLDRSWLVHLRKTKGKWAEALGSEPAATGLAKQHNLCGPIDDAFMDSFLFVKPTGQGWNDKTAAWVKSELDHASFEWRRQFRGDAPAKDDKAITEQDIAANNLVLWGDPGSNSVLARVIEKLPLKWTKDGLIANQTKHPATAMPLLIYPNPLNPKRYVVINSGFTYREYDYLNNARQIAKLPDWTIVDGTSTPTAREPGKVLDAGFFDEAWQWKAAVAKP